jgi:hypothetical protein
VESRPAGAGCILRAPGTLALSKEADGKKHYELKREKEGIRFELSYFDVLAATPGAARKARDDAANELRDALKAKLNGTVTERASGTRREALVRGPGNETCVMRVSYRRVGGTTRIYQLIVSGPNLSLDTGDAAKFIRSLRPDPKVRF